MSIIQGDRTLLDRYLVNPRMTLLLLTGKPGSNADPAHATAVQGVNEPWRVTLWIQDPTVLNATEAAWLPGDNRFAAVCGVVKTLRSSGPISQFMLPDGSADILQIKLAFADADGGVQPPPVNPGT